MIVNGLMLSAYAITCLLPMLHMLALSLSNSTKAEVGLVGLIPVGFNLDSYKLIFSNNEFYRAFGNSLLRLLVGVPLNMLMTVLAAYPLSRPNSQLRFRTLISWFFVFTTIFSGGMIPSYMLVNALHLNDTVWALVLPSAVPVFNVILMINFFKQVPEDFYEAALLDGAGELTIMSRIYVPLALPSIVTVLLFIIVSHWNAWFDGVIYMSDIKYYPLQSYLQSVVINKFDLASMYENIGAYANLSQQTVDAARLFMAVTPIILIYLPLQKYFIKGLTLGGVKG